MRPGPCLRLLIVGAAALLAPLALAETVPTGTVMPGTPCATPFWIKQGEAEGPRLFVAGGFHGDEKAGYLAGDKLVEWKITRGTLILIPRAHQMAIARGVRAYPANVNTLFPGEATGDLMHRLAAAIWSVMRDSQPDMVITLHESLGFYREHPERFGQTLTYDFPELAPRLKKLADRANPDLPTERERFLLKLAPYPHCPTYEAYRWLHVPAATIETCRELPLETRVRHQLMMLMAIMDDLGMEYEPADGLPRLSTAPGARAEGER